MSWYKKANPIVDTPSGMDYDDIGHIGPKGEIYLYVIDRGKFIFEPSNYEHLDHQNVIEWKYTEFNTSGRIDKKRKIASLNQSFPKNMEMRKRFEHKIAVDGIHKNFGTDIKIHEFKN